MSSKHGESDDRKWAESIGLEYAHDTNYYENEVANWSFSDGQTCNICRQSVGGSTSDKIQHMEENHLDVLNMRRQETLEIDLERFCPECGARTEAGDHLSEHLQDKHGYSVDDAERASESKAKEMGAYADLKGLAEDQWASMSESERQITLNNINMQNYVSERMFKEFYEDDEIPTSFESEIVDAVVSDYGLEDDLHDKQTWESKATEGDTKQVLLDWIDEMGEGWHITPDQVDDFVDYAVSRGIARQDALWYFQNAPSSLGGTTYESKATEDFFDNLNKSDSENEEWEDDDKGGTVDPYTGEPIDEEDKSFWNTGRKKSKEIDTLDSISQAEFDSPYDDLSEDEKQEVNSIMDDPWQGESIDEEPDIGTPFEDTPSGQGESKAGEYEGEDEPEYHDMSNVPDAEEHDVEISEPATEYDVAIDPEEDETPEENEDGQAGNVWQCPECGFNTISKDEYDNHSHSNVPATVGKPQSEESIAQPSNDYSILQRFR